MQSKTGRKLGQLSCKLGQLSCKRATHVTELRLLTTSDAHCETSVLVTTDRMPPCIYHSRARPGAPARSGVLPARIAPARRRPCSAHRAVSASSQAASVIPLDQLLHVAQHAAAEGANIVGSASHQRAQQCRRAVGRP